MYMLFFLFCVFVPFFCVFCFLYHLLIRSCSRGCLHASRLRSESRFVSSLSVGGIDYATTPMVFLASVWGNRWHFRAVGPSVTVGAPEYWLQAVRRFHCHKWCLIKIDRDGVHDVLFLAYVSSTPSVLGHGSSFDQETSY